MHFNYFEPSAFSRLSSASRFGCDFDRVSSERETRVSTRTSAHGRVYGVEDARRPDAGTIGASTPRICAGVR